MSKYVKLTMQDGSKVTLEKSGDLNDITFECRKSPAEHAFKIYNTLYTGVKTVLKEFYESAQLDAKEIVRADYYINDQLIDTIVADQHNYIMCLWYLKNGALSGSVGVYTLEEQDKEYILINKVPKVVSR